MPRYLNLGLFFYYHILDWRFGSHCIPQLRQHRWTSVLSWLQVISFSLTVFPVSNQKSINL